MRYFKTSQPLIISYASKEEIEKLWSALNELREILQRSEQNNNGIWITNKFITKTNVITLMEKFKDLDEILDDDWTSGLSTEHKSAEDIIKKFKEGEE